MVSGPTTSLRASLGPPYNHLECIILPATAEHTIVYRSSDNEQYFPVLQNSPTCSAFWRLCSFAAEFMRSTWSWTIEHRMTPAHHSYTCSELLCSLLHAVFQKHLSMEVKPRSKGSEVQHGLSQCKVFDLKPFQNLQHKACSTHVSNWPLTVHEYMTEHVIHPLIFSAPHCFANCSLQPPSCILHPHRFQSNWHILLELRRKWSCTDFSSIKTSCFLPYRFLKLQYHITLGLESSLQKYSQVQSDGVEWVSKLTIFEKISWI